jgi:hypothetical protein
MEDRADQYGDDVDPGPFREAAQLFTHCLDHLLRLYCSTATSTGATFSRRDEAG